MVLAVIRLAALSSVRVENKSAAAGREKNERRSQLKTPLLEIGHPIFHQRTEDGCSLYGLFFLFRSDSAFGSRLFDDLLCDLPRDRIVM
jgi:hypothetical protein